MRGISSNILQPPPDDLSYIDKIYYLHEKKEELLGQPVVLEGIVISEAGQRIIEWFDLPESQKDRLLIYRHNLFSDLYLRTPSNRDKDIANLVNIFTPVIKKDARLSRKKGANAYEKEQMTVSVSAHYKKAFKVFLIEMYFIGWMYDFCSAKPTKDQMNEALSDLRKVQKHINAINQIMRGYLQASISSGINKKSRDANARYNNKPSFFRLQDAILAEYQKLRRYQGANEKDGLHAINDYWMASNWIEPAISNVVGNDLQTYSARDRSTTRRDSAIKALADSYWRCFNVKPTATTTNGKANFYTCMQLMWKVSNGARPAIEKGYENSLLKKLIKEVVQKRGK